MVFEFDSSIINTIIGGIIGTIWGMLINTYQHTKKETFNTAISKIYDVLVEYINTANEFKVKVNSIPIKSLEEHDSELLEKHLTFPLLELSNKTHMLEMFFDEYDREKFQKVLSIANDFNKNIYVLFTLSKNKINHINNEQIKDIYNEAREKFNYEYDFNINEVVAMIYSQLLGKWQSNIWKRIKHVIRKLRHKKKADKQQARQC